MKTVGLICMIVAMCMGVGCKSINSGLSQTVFDERIQDSFSLGMSSESTEHELRRLSLEHFSKDTKIIAHVYPQWSPIPGVNSFWNTYGMRNLFFEFGDDDALDTVMYERKHNQTHPISLDSRQVVQ